MHECYAHFVAKPELKLKIYSYGVYKMYLDKNFWKMVAIPCYYIASPISNLIIKSVIIAKH